MRLSKSVGRLNVTETGLAVTRPCLAVTNLAHRPHDSIIPRIIFEPRHYSWREFWSARGTRCDDGIARDALAV